MKAENLEQKILEKITELTQTSAPDVENFEEFLDDKGLLKREVSFGEDLGLDSLDLILLVMEFEKEFKVEIPEDKEADFKTVRDAINIIQSLI